MKIKREVVSGVENSFKTYIKFYETVGFDLKIVKQIRTSRYFRVLFVILIFLLAVLSYALIQAIDLLQVRLGLTIFEQNRIIIIIFVYLFGLLSFYWWKRVKMKDNLEIILDKQYRIQPSGGDTSYTQIRNVGTFWTLNKDVQSKLEKQNSVTFDNMRQIAFNTDNEDNFKLNPNLEIYPVVLRSNDKIELLLPIEYIEKQSNYEGWELREIIYNEFPSLFDEDAKKWYDVGIGFLRFLVNHESDEH